MNTAVLDMALSWGETLQKSAVGLIVVICVLAFIALSIIVISKIFGAVEKAFAGKKKTEAPAEKKAEAAPTKPAGRPLPETESQGELVLENVDEPTAAVIMAIVSNQSGIPLNRLAFKSIKLIEEN